MLIGLAGAGGCTLNRPIRIVLPDSVKRPEKCVVVLWVDGLNEAKLQQMLAAGRLPNLNKHLFARGSQVDLAVTVLPAITNAVNASMMTGLLPSRHNITGNIWFDRRTLTLQNYEGMWDCEGVEADLTQPTLFEMIPDLYSVSVLTPIHRGATRNHCDQWTTGATWFFSTTGQVDALTTWRMNAIGREAGEVGRWPDVIWLYYPGPDHVAHEHSHESRQYEASLCDLDVQVGRVVSVLEQAGVFDRTLMALVSDHGFAVADPSKAMDLSGRLRDLGLTVGTKKQVGGTYEKRREAFAPDRIVLVDDGNRRAMLHLRAGDAWLDRPTLDQIERFGRDFGGPALRADSRPFWNVLLSMLPPGRLAAVRDGADRVMLTDGVGKSVVARRPRAAGGEDPAAARASVEQYRYQVTQPPDPLGLIGHPGAAALLDGQFHSSLAWLDATCDSRTPDLVAQIVDYLDSNRCGDLSLYSMSDWQFRVDGLGGHGSVTGDDMHIPMVFAGPGIAAGGHVRTARIVDLVPTVLDYLGRLQDVSKKLPLDGISRLGQLRH